MRESERNSSIDIQDFFGVKMWEYRFFSLLSYRCFCGCEAAAAFCCCCCSSSQDSKPPSSSSSSSSYTWEKVCFGFWQSMHSMIRGNAKTVFMYILLFGNYNGIHSKTAATTTTTATKRQQYQHYQQQFTFATAASSSSSRSDPQKCSSSSSAPPPPLFDPSSIALVSNSMCAAVKTGSSFLPGNPVVLAEPPLRFLWWLARSRRIWFEVKSESQRRLLTATCTYTAAMISRETFEEAFRPIRM